LVLAVAANDDVYSAEHFASEETYSGVKKDAKTINLQLFLRIFLHERLDGSAMLIAAWLLAFVASSPIKYR